MSLRITSAVWQSDRYRDGARLVLLALADFADNDGVCWPSVRILAERAQIGERQVQNILREFRETGVITVEHGGGRGISNRYRLHPETLKPISPKSEKVKPISLKSATERMNSSSQKGEIGDIAIRKNHHEPSIEPSENLLCAEPEKTPASAPASSPPILTLPCAGKGPKEYPVTQQLIEEWRSAFPGVDVLVHLEHRIPAWLNANPTKRKTYRGMPRFIVNWLSREQDHQPANYGEKKGYQNGHGFHHDGNDARYEREADLVIRNE